MEQQRARLEQRRARNRAAKLKKAEDVKRLTGGKKPLTGNKSDEALATFLGRDRSRKTSTAKSVKKTQEKTKSITNTSKTSEANSSGRSLRSDPTPPKISNISKTSVGNKAPKEGDTKTMNGSKYVYRRGSWQRVKPNGYIYG